MIYDLSGPRPTTELDTESTVNLSTHENRFYSRGDTGQKRPMVVVGTVTARNEFDFGRTADLPGYAVCLYGANVTRPVIVGRSRDHWTISNRLPLRTFQGVCGGTRSDR